MEQGKRQKAEGKSADHLLTYDDLAARWGICPRQVRRACERLRLRPLNLGHRTKRFRPVDVVRAEERAAVKAEGRRAA